MLKFIKKVWYAIMNVFKVDGNLSIDTSNVYVNGSKADLSICQLDTSEYYQLVSSGKCASNTLYVISSSSINAYGQKIENLGMPMLSDDAATKGYVDNQIGQLPDISKLVTRDEVAQIAKDVFKSNLQSILSSL